MVSCCLPGSRVLLGKGTGIPKSDLPQRGWHSYSKEAGFNQLWWIKEMISSTLTAVWVDKTTTKGPLQWGFSIEHSIPLPKQHPLVYKGVWEFSG
jgi:hypothetical protein